MKITYQALSNILTHVINFDLTLNINDKTTVIELMEQLERQPYKPCSLEEVIHLKINTIVVYSD